VRHRSALLTNYFANDTPEVFAQDFFRSLSEYPRFGKTTPGAGLLETSPKPFAVPAVPSKSLPIPTWSIPAIFTVIRHVLHRRYNFYPRPKQLWRLLRRILVQRLASQWGSLRLGLRRRPQLRGVPRMDKSHPEIDPHDPTVSDQRAKHVMPDIPGNT
jgi:hypothetical protein